MSGNTYQIVEFSVNDFLEFTGKPRNNYYQIKKLGTKYQIWTCFVSLKNRSKGWYTRKKLKIS